MTHTNSYKKKVCICVCFLPAASVRGHLSLADVFNPFNRSFLALRLGRLRLVFTGFTPIRQDLNSDSFLFYKLYLRLHVWFFGRLSILCQLAGIYRCACCLGNGLLPFDVPSCSIPLYKRECKIFLVVVCNARRDIPSTTCIQY